MGLLREISKPRPTARIFMAIATICCARSSLAVDRIVEGLQALYEFNEPSGDVVHDTSGARPPIDLQINSPETVKWWNGSLSIQTGVVIRSLESSGRLAEACRQLNELTIEAWVTPANDAQGGPAPIVSLSADTGQRNFILGQEGGKYEGRLRTTALNE